VLSKTVTHRYFLEVAIDQKILFISGLDAIAQFNKKAPLYKVYKGALVLILAF